MTFDVVVPTVGRDSLRLLLSALAAADGPPPGRVLVVDDRRDRSRTLPVGELAGAEVVAGRGAGPAAARNLGWRRASAEWVAFLDDDVVPSPTWLADLARDLDSLGPEVAASQGRVRVPMPSGRRPTDWERNVRGLETARWATADMAYRRPVLDEVGGFDERFPRAYREDADLGLRVVRAGYQIVTGRRQVSHPVRAAGGLISLRLQAGNTDDALMWGLHGPRWRGPAGVPRGRRRRHLVVTGLGLVGVGGLLVARREPWAGRARWVAVLAGAGWLAGTVELALARILPGPRTPGEVVRMSVTSVLMPPVATWHWLAGWARLPWLLVDRERAPRPAGRPAPSRPADQSASSHVTGRPARSWSAGHPAPARAAGRRPARRRPARSPAPSRLAGRTTPRAADPPAPPQPAGLPATSPITGLGAPPPPASRGRPHSPSPRPFPLPKAVLFDRDGTLVADVPYNGDPGRVVLMPGAREAVARVRAAGVATAVVSNQSGVARGRIRVEQVEAVNRRVEELLGPLGPWLVCLHGPGDGCGCRKPAPGLIEAAAGALGVDARDCVVIGDIGADVEAARAAGARGVLVPTAVTRAEEVAAAPEVAADLVSAVELVLGPSGGRS